MGGFVVFIPAVLFPGLCLLATVLGLNLLGDALRDALAPGQE